MGFISDQALDEIVAVTESPSSDLLDLLALCSLDPKSDFRHADLADTDFGEADIAEWDLTGADLSNANLSKVKNIMLAIFDEQTTFLDTVLPEGVAPADLVHS